MVVLAKLALLVSLLALVGRIRANLAPRVRQIIYLVPAHAMYAHQEDTGSKQELAMRVHQDTLQQLGAWNV